MFHDEDSFQAHLDEHPDDYYARAVYADWLDEQGENDRAEGLRAMCACRLNGSNGYSDYDAPTVTTEWMTGMETCWFKDGELCYKPGAHDAVPADWFDALHNEYRNTGWTNNYADRRTAEDALARAFGSLPEDRRRELLSGVRNPTSATASS